MFSGSTSHLPLLAGLGHVEVVAGVASPGIVINAEVRARIESGGVVGYAPNRQINTELVIERAPDILMTGGTDSPAYQVLRDSGVNVVANAEWLESDPLGRAEWIKLVALYLNEEARATERFNEIESAYQALVARTSAIPREQRPTVMTGSQSGGIYYAAGGRNYVAQFIKDAGGSYVWADNQNTGSITTDLETQLERAGTADIWINGRLWNSLADVVAEDPRYGEFKAYKEGNIWLFNRVIGPGGIEEYWELGLTRPDLVLADLVQIFHPDLSEEHDFRWYKKVLDE
jgi:iron complex transport system substrate-binding protein